MAMVTMLYKHLSLAGLVLSSILPICYSAVEDCSPCDPGKYCSTFFGLCLSCRDYCPGGPDCPSECLTTKLNISTPLSTTTTATTQVYSTFQPPLPISDSPGTTPMKDPPSINTNVPSGGVNTNGDNYLSAELVFGLFIILSFTGILICLCRKYYETLKIPEICCFFRRVNSNSGSIELRAIQRHPSGTYSAVQVDEDLEQPGPSRQRSRLSQRPSGEAMSAPAQIASGCQESTGDDIPDKEQPGPSRQRSRLSQRPSGEAMSAPAQIASGCQESPGDDIPDKEQPGPSRQRSRLSQRPSREATAAPAQSASGCQNSPDTVNIFQSASISPSASVREFDKIQQARPTVNRSPPPEKTPETLRKITDGTHGKVTIGVSSFDPPIVMVEDIRRNQQTGHGD